MLRSLLLWTCLWWLGGLAHAETLRVEGSASLVLPFTNATALLAQQGLEVKVNTNSNSPHAIAAVGLGQADLAVSTRLVTAEERSNFPDRPMVETVIGYQALALIVSVDVWEGGVRSLSKSELQGIYEGKITDWKQVGGPSREIKFYNPEKGKGVWEFYATWLYGENQKAPVASSFETVGTAEETRNVVEFNNGSLSIIASNQAESKGTRALAIRVGEGKLVQPTPAKVRGQAYPIVRPVVVVTAFRPAGPYKKALDVMRSSQGQGFVRSADMVPVLEEETE